jgi:hypothetical protein
VNSPRARIPHEQHCEYRVPHKTIPSFTVEIKRARKPSVNAPTRKGVMFENDIRRAMNRLPAENLFAATKPPTRLTPDSEINPDAPRVRTGRILPSLTCVDPLQARQETKDRPALGSMARKAGSKVATVEEPDVAAASPRGLASDLPEVRVTSDMPAAGPTRHAGAVRDTRVTASSPAEMPSRPAGEQRGRKGTGYWRAYRKAVRRGLSLPPLAVGQRWKRRLPVVCR